jgi:hypothetical protein
MQETQSNNTSPNGQERPQAGFNAGSDPNTSAGAENRSKLDQAIEASRAIAVAIAAGAPSAKFCGFALMPDEKKQPYSRRGNSVGIDTPDDALLGAEDVATEPPPQGAAYYGLFMQRVTKVDDLLLWCIDIDNKKRAPHDPKVTALAAAAKLHGLLREVSISGTGGHIFLLAPPDATLPANVPVGAQNLELFGMPANAGGRSSSKSVFLSGSRMGGTLVAVPSLREFLRSAGIDADVEAGEARASAAPNLEADPLYRVLKAQGLVVTIRKDGGVNIVCPNEDEHTTPSPADGSDSTYWPAHTGGYAKAGYRCMHSHCEKIGIRDLKRRVGFVDLEFEFGDTTGGGEADDPLRLEVGGSTVETGRHADLMNDYAPPQFLIDRILHGGGVVTLTGPTGGGKSTKAALMAAHYVTRTPMAGHEVHNPDGKTVLFLAADDYDGTLQRIQALKEADDLGLNWEGAPEMLIEEDPFAFDHAAVKGMIAYIERHNVGLVVVDTSIIYSSPDAEENNAGDMQRKMTAGKLITAKTGATVLLMTHPNEAARIANDPARFVPRGSGAVLAAVQGNLTVHDPSGGDGDIRELGWAGKFRGKKFRPVPFKLRNQTLRRFPECAPPVAVLNLAADAFDVHAGICLRRAELIGHLLTSLERKTDTMTAQQIAEWLHKIGELESTHGNVAENKPLRDALARAEQQGQLKSVGTGRGKTYQKKDTTAKAREASRQWLGEKGFPAWNVFE